jgi:hypothetical protein
MPVQPWLDLSLLLLVAGTAIAPTAAEASAAFLAKCQKCLGINR